MTFHLGRTSVRLHPLLPFFWLLACFLGGAERLLPMLLALLLHESGHLIIGRILGMRAEEIELTPFGGVISMRNMSAARPLHAFLLSAAGPVFSLLGCFLASVIAPLLGFPFAQTFARGNLLLLLVNLVPALPLDGGRMVRALLSHFIPYSAATRILVRIGYVLGALLGMVSLIFAVHGQINFSPAFAGMYLIYAAAQEGRQGTARYVTALIARRQRLDRKEILPVEFVAAREDLPARELLRSLTPGKYHLILALSPDGMECRSVLDEKAFCEAIINHGEEPLSSFSKKSAEFLSADKQI